MTIAAECEEIELLTPSVLANVAVPPVFKLRPASGREARKYHKLLREEGLSYHSVEEIREEILNGLRELWTPEDYEGHSARLRAHWALVDQGGTADPQEEAHIQELNERIGRAHRPLAGMLADNLEFIEESQKVALSMFLVGWTGLELSYGREAGRVPMQKLDELEDLLGEIEQQAIDDKVEGLGTKPGLAYLMLCNAASGRLLMTKDQEKNSPSPPSAPPSPNGSNKKRSSKTGGAKSKASASSVKTQSEA